MTLKQKIKRYQRIRQELPKLEREIRNQAEPILRSEGLQALPRIERIIERFAA